MPFLATTRKADAWDNEAGSRHLHALIGEMHSGTWASNEFLAGVTHLRGGTLAGNALGDLVFTAAMAVVLRDMRKGLRSAGLVHALGPVTCPFTGESLPSNSENPQPMRDRSSDSHDDHALMTDISYVDDTFVPIIAKSQTLLGKVKAAMPIVHASFVRHGFSANYAKGKTEIVVACNGPGANELKKTLAHKHDSVVTFQDEQGKPHDVQCVPAYKHLGSMRSATESMAAEIRARCASVASIAGRLSAKVLRNPHIGVAMKANIVKAYILSRVLYNAGAWPTLTSAELSRLHSCIMKLMRRIAATGLGKDKPAADEPTSWTSDQETYMTTGFAAPVVMVARLRLLLMLRVLSKAPTCLRLALAAAAPARRSWYKAVANDFQWFANNTTQLSDLNHLTVEGMIGVALANPRAFRRRLNAAVADADNSAKAKWAITAAQKALGEKFPCPQCGLTFDSRQAAAVHAYKLHGTTRPIRRKVETHFCVACLQHFGSIERVVCHLAEKATKCVATYLADIPDLDDNTFNAASVQAAAEAKANVAEGRKRHYASLPVIRLQGPHSHTASRAGICHARLLRDGKRGRSVAEILEDLAASRS